VCKIMISLSKMEWLWNLFVGKKTKFVYNIIETFLSRWGNALEVLMHLHDKIYATFLCFCA